MSQSDAVKSATLILVSALAVAGLSACGGGGGGGGTRPSDPGGQVVITPPSTEPDLAVGTPSVTNTTPNAGASFTLRATVRNGGDGPSGSTTLRYYRSTDATITTSDTAVGTDAVSALSASATSAELILLTAPSSAGTYYYGACVDTVSGESDTANNCSSGAAVTVSAGSPGIAPANQAAFDRQTIGRRLDASAYILHFVSSGRFVEFGRNSSYEYSGSYNYINTGRDTGTLTLNYHGGAFGGSCTLRLTYASSTTGTVRFTCASGIRGQNNWRLTGSNTPGNGPDLVVESRSVSDSSPDAGASFTLRATVRNGGDGPSGSTTLRYYRSTDATITTSDTAVGTDAVSALSASATSAELILLTAPSSAGTYYYGACVDSVSGESDTANNCSSGVRVTVSSAGRGTDCYVGLLVRPGESCTYPGTTDEFSVDSSGSGRFLFFGAGTGLNIVGSNINGRIYTLVATNQGGGVWRIDRVGR